MAMKLTVKHEHSHLRSSIIPPQMPQCTFHQIIELECSDWAWCDSDTVRTQFLNFYYTYINIYNNTEYRLASSRRVRTSPTYPSLAASSPPSHPPPHPSFEAVIAYRGGIWRGRAEPPVGTDSTTSWPPRHLQQARIRQIPALSLPVSSSYTRSAWKTVSVRVCSMRRVTELKS